MQWGLTPVLYGGQTPVQVQGNAGLQQVVKGDRRNQCALRRVLPPGHMWRFL